jgi:glycosyltransferase involved in cell wall biosynthesis
LRVVIVSGIWPPDVGGPASHAPEVAAFLVERGHEVTVVVTAAGEPSVERYPVRHVSRSLPKGVLHALGGAAIARVARGADVVYATGMFARSAAACTLVRRPLVLKLTGDPAFERARWRGRVDGGVRSFQRGGGGLEAAGLRRLRALTLRAAAYVVCPSAFLRDLALSWGVPPGKVSVLPNATPPLPPLRSREELRRSFEFDGPTLAFAGRLGPQKALNVALAAVQQVEGVAFVLAGDGEERARLERAAGTRVRFLGPLPRERVLELFAAADATVLSSSWENFPHTVVESLAVGTPVIATRVGGVPDIVEDGVNGLLVPAGDAEALADAVRRFVQDDALRARLSAAATPSVERFRPDHVYGELERILAGVVR